MYWENTKSGVPGYTAHGFGLPKFRRREREIEHGFEQYCLPFCLYKLTVLTSQSSIFYQLIFFFFFLNNFINLSCLSICMLCWA